MLDIVKPRHKLFVDECLSLTKYRESPQEGWFVEIQYLNDICQTENKNKLMKLNSYTHETLTVTK